MYNMISSDVKHNINSLGQRIYVGDLVLYFGARTGIPRIGKVIGYKRWEYGSHLYPVIESYSPICKNIRWNAENEEYQYDIVGYRRYSRVLAVMNAFRFLEEDVIDPEKQEILKRLKGLE